MHAGEFGIVYKAKKKKGFLDAFSETVAVKTLKGTPNILLSLGYTPFEGPCTVAAGDVDMP